MKNLELRSLIRQSLRNFENVEYATFAEDYLCLVKRVPPSGNETVKLYEVVIYNINSNDTSNIITVTELSNVFQCEYLPFYKVLWIGSKSEFVIIHPVSGNVSKIPGYLSVEDGEGVLLNLDNARWDPTGNFLIASKLDGTVTLFVVDLVNAVLDELQTASIQDSVYKVEQLNWGSADRQFRSQEEQLLIKEFKDEVPLMEETKIANISWRQNGENVVINYYNEGKRKLKVYDEAWKLIHESEDIPGLQSVISWKASSVVFAGVVHTSKRTQIIIFEKNCEIKSRHDLQRKVPVYQLKWNDSGNVLAVHQDYNGKDHSNIDLYVFKNSTMYLKQRLVYTNYNPLIDFEFLKSDRHLYELRTVTGKEAVTYSYRFTYNSNVFYEEQPQALCVAVQGTSALVTRCINGMRPPPDFDVLIKVENPINFVFFHPNKSFIALVDCCNILYIYKVEGEFTSQIKCFNLCNEQDRSIVPLKYHHFLWIDDSRINYLQEPFDGKSIDILCLSKDTLNVSRVSSEQRGIHYMGLIKNSEKMIRQIGNEIFLISEGNNSEKLFSLLSVPIDVKSISIEGHVYVLSLMSNASFYINEVEVISDVMSFIIYHNYLLLTTLKGNLMGMRLNKQSLTELNEKDLTNLFLRQIEQGSHLICGIPSTPYVAAQMPRGNVELYSCRIIVVDTLDDLLEKNKWKEALEFVRSTRLNMNALVDLNFTRFINNIEMFINSAKDPDTLSDFLIELQDGNVFNTIYTNCIEKKEEIPRKIEFICDVMMNYMEQVNYIYYINTIVTACFVKNSPTSCKDALFYIQTLLKEAQKQPKLMSDVEKAYKIALTFRSATEMYKAALLSYDLNLILFTAMNSGVEPSEFVPFIRELENVDSKQRQFKIHDFLKEHNEALKCLVCYGADEEIFSYVEKYQLFEQAQWLLKANTNLRSKILKEVAQNLSEKNKFEEAAIYYERIGAREEALEEYVKALCWSEAIKLLKELGKSNDETSEKLHELVEGLKNANRVKEAAKIYDKYLNDYETGIMLCIEQKLFDYAIKLAVKHNRNDIYETDITMAVLDYCKQLHDKFLSMLQEFSNKKNRLNTVREEKKNQHLREIPAVSEVPEELQDQVSLAPSSTIASMRSSISRKTSRSRRKQERKKHSTREGGVFEDIALMENLYNLVHEAFQWGPKVQELCILVMKFQHVDLIPPGVVQMYCSLVKLQKTMESSFQEIWPPALTSISLELTDAIVYENISQLELKYRAPPNNIKIQWTLKAFSAIDTSQNHLT